MEDLRPIVGLDVAPELGMRVVGADDSPYQEMGLGTVVRIGEGELAGTCAVRWDREGKSARPPSEYFCGRNGVLHLEVAQSDDVLLREKDRENLYTLAAASLRSHKDEASQARLPQLAAPGLGGSVHPRVQSARGAKGGEVNPRGGHATAPATAPAARSPRADWRPPGALGASASAGRTGRRPTAASAGAPAAPQAQRRRSQPQRSPAALLPRKTTPSERERQSGENRRALIALFNQHAHGMRRRRFFGYDVAHFTRQTVQSMDLAELLQARPTPPLSAPEMRRPSGIPTRSGGTRRVGLVREEGRGVSSQYGREGEGGGFSQNCVALLPSEICHPSEEALQQRRGAGLADALPSRCSRA
jgi:hypothetical protein